MCTTSGSLSSPRDLREASWLDTTEEREDRLGGREDRLEARLDDR